MPKGIPINKHAVDTGINDLIAMCSTPYPSTDSILFQGVRPSATLYL
jgi:hypothetical protein